MSSGRPVAAAILSIIGGLLVLGFGVGMILVKSLALHGNLLPPFGNLIGGAYAPMVGTGFNRGASYVIGVVTGVIPGVLMIIGGAVMLGSPSRASRVAYVVLAAAFVSLFGPGGGVIGALLGIFGGSIGVLRAPSSPKLMPFRQPKRPRLS